MVRQHKNTLYIILQMARFCYKNYMNAPTKEAAQWDSDNNGFTIIVGTNKTTFPNKYDKAGMSLLQYAKFHISKDTDRPMLEVVSYDGDENYKEDWYSDAQLMKLDILKMQMEEFINEYPFTGEGFTKFARKVLRPINDGGCKFNKSWIKKHLVH